MTPTTPHDDPSLSLPTLLEYAYVDPPALVGVRFSVARLLAFGYVAACVAALIAMGVAMAMSV